MTQTDLQNAIAHIYPTIVYPGSYTVIIDTAGNATIGLWNNAVAPQPSIEQLSAALGVILVTPAQVAQVAVLLAAYRTARYGTPATIIPASGGAALTFPSDPDTQSNLVGYLVAFNGTDFPAQMPLEDTMGVAQMLTYADMQNLAKLIATQSIEAWQTFKNLQVQVGSAMTVANVQQIVWPTK